MHEHNVLIIHCKQLSTLCQIVKMQHAKMLNSKFFWYKNFRFMVFHVKCVVWITCTCSLWVICEGYGLYYRPCTACLPMLCLQISGLAVVWIFFSSDSDHHLLGRLNYTTTTSSSVSKLLSSSHCTCTLDCTLCPVICVCVVMVLACYYTTLGVFSALHVWSF